MYDVFEKLLEYKGVTAYQVCRATGLTTASISNWKAGRYTPKTDKMQKIADFFGVSIEYLMTGRDTEKTSDSGNKYYFSDETAELAQELFDNKDMRILFDAARDSKPEDLKLAAEMLSRFKETNPNG